MVMIDVSPQLVAVGTLLGLAVTGEYTNLARGKHTNASSVYTDSIPVHPGLVTDGSDVTVWESGSCFSTELEDREPWWLVDLEEVYTIVGFMVRGRSDCCHERLQDFTVETFLKNPAHSPTTVASHCYFYSGYPVPGLPEVVNCETYVKGRYFRVRRSQRLEVCEIGIYEAPKGPMCNKFTGMMNARIHAVHGKNISGASSVVQCAKACSKMMCLAFNFGWAEDPGCHIIPEIRGELEYDHGWRLFKRNEC